MTLQKRNIDRPLRLAVVHWLPLEQFPPAKNLLDLFGNDPAFCVTACTSIRSGESHPWGSEAVNQHRSTFPGAGQSAAVRLLQALRLCLTILLGLLRSRAEAVLYFEPHSAPAVFSICSGTAPLVFLFTIMNTANSRTTATGEMPSPGLDTGWNLAGCFDAASGSHTQTSTGCGCFWTTTRRFPRP
ncbi:MAG UNVERIFIED_CONTAM: hypothetical protein LVR18_21695 [Planctomycetaceae bacterium]|jgi:hypothetical protein